MLKHGAGFTNNNPVSDRWADFYFRKPKVFTF